jgi:flagellar hook assembly protein FlgD
MTTSKSWLSAIVAGAVIVHSAPAPMEPAERTLFLFVHGINPKCSGAIDNATDADDHRSLACEDPPKLGPDEPVLGPFCVDRSQLLGRSSHVWVKGLDGKRSDDALFCTLKGNLFQGQYSLRSFTDPGASPLDVAHELGDRDWKTPKNPALRSHVIEAMRRYLEHRRQIAVSKAREGRPRSEFESALDSLYQGIPITDPRAIVAAFPDSVPSRLVVLAHSMGGLTTREYLVSDYYNQDLDKVVTFDSPHNGSWVAFYNQAGPRSIWNKPSLASSLKLGLGFGMFASFNPVVDQLATLFTISGASGGTAALFQNYGGNIGNDFKGDEEGSRYLEPGSDDLKELNSRTTLACENTGCSVPSFVLYSTDGVLAPDDPSKLIGGHPLRALLPTELIDMATASYMTLSRDWPESVGFGDLAYNASIAAAFAEGGWNYTQHGSLPVTSSSGRGRGIAMLERPDAAVVRHEPLTYGRKYAADAVGQIASRQVNLAAIFVGHQALQISANTASAFFGNPYVAQPMKFYSALQIGVLLGADAVARFGLYAAAYAPSHNLAVGKSATERTTVSHSDALGATVNLHPTWIESDLYEKPFVQIRWTEGDSTSAGSKALRLLAADTLPPPVSFQLGDLSRIDYSRPGWEERWAIRRETHVPAGTSGTTVRRVERWSLPFQLLTENDIRRMEMQVDDLRPDLLEQMTISVNWGKTQLTWDRERSSDGSDLGTYRLTYSTSGEVKSTTSGLANPVDNYGRWTVDFDAHLESSVLKDGQNQIAIALVNHAGKRSVQRQFITWQATPPLVAMTFPQPWEAVSGDKPQLRARVTLLSYMGLSIDPDRSGWKVDTGSNVLETPSDSLFATFAGREEGMSEFPIDQALPAKDDGFWLATFRTVSVTAEKQFKVAERKIPFYLDRKPPNLVLEGSRSPTRPGEEREFVLTWSDADSREYSSLEILRSRILDSNGAVVAELAPVGAAVGERMVLHWNGKISGRNAADGKYTLKVDARDAAVPDSATRSTILRLRDQFADASATWSGHLDPIQDATWNSLRIRSDLNWGDTSIDFRIDGSAPLAEFDPLPTATLSRDDRLQIRFRLRDPGARDSSDAVRMRFAFTPASGTTELPHALEALHTDVAGQSGQENIRIEGESLDGMEFLLPDGSWNVSAVGEDGSGNRTDWSHLGTIAVDRTPPSIASLRTTHVMIPEGSSPTGEVFLDVSDARTVQATWVSPNGSRRPAVPELTQGLWTAPYPPDLGATKGVWALEVVARDGAGNTSHARTQLWVGLLPPKIAIAGTGDTGVAIVTGSVALVGVAMDPLVDLHPFVSYALQWRWKGDTAWHSEGLRVPAGRAMPDHPGRSRREQSHEGLLGFWNPPSGSGTIELRVLVDDGSGLTEGREHVREVYRSADEPIPFSTVAHIEPRLGTSVSTRLGMEIQSSRPSKARYRAQVLLTDSKGDVLMAKDLIDLESSRFEGTPSEVATGALQLWHDERLHLRANGTCRAFRVRMMVANPDSLVISHPDGWIIHQRSMDPLTMPKELGGATYRRILEIDLPAQATGELVLDLDATTQVAFEGDSSASCPVSVAACPTTTGMAATGGIRSNPQPGELTTGRTNLPWCEVSGTAVLEPGLSSWNVEWNGIRPNGTVPSSGPARLEVVAWDPSSGRTATSTATTVLVAGEGKLMAWANEEVSIATNAPAVQRKAALGFRLEGRGASLDLRVLSGDSIVKTLQGSGSWYEARSGSLPYGVTWDGTNDAGDLVQPGTYTFLVSEREGDLRSEASVVVTGSSWKEDPSISLSIPESRWDSVSLGWRLSPVPELKVSTELSGASHQGGPFTYAADWSGKQLATVFPTSRFSLMVHRKRKTVKFGIIFRMVLTVKDYDKGFCGGDDNRKSLQQFTEVNVLELEPGMVGRIDLLGEAKGGGSSVFRRMTGGPHLVEYRVVPLSAVDAMSSDQLSEEEKWEKANSLLLTSGSFVVNDLSVTPTFGQFENRAPKDIFEWILPSSPYRCEDSLLQTFGDVPGKGVQTSAQNCGKASLQDRELYNPHRNLLQFRALPWIDRNDFKITRGPYRHLSYAFGDLSAHCAGSARWDWFGTHLEFMVPDEYWNPPTGLENLANRFLRFDSRNKFLFGPNGYMAHDDHDNDGIGPGDNDDPGEVEGEIAAFERRQFRWRPHGKDRVMIRTPCANDPRQWCDSGLAMNTVVKTSESGKIIERPDDDPLYFFEGDHGLLPDTLRAWFENTPEQGDATWSATIEQDGSSIRLDSTNVGEANAVSFPVIRMGQRFIEPDVRISDPVDITVRMSGGLSSLQKDAWRKPVAWPLDSTSFAREKQRIEQECTLSGHGGCRLFAAASGVRFGFQDGQESTDPKYSSLPQQRLFEDLSRRVHSNPGSIPGGIPTGSGRQLFTGLLSSDASGRLRHSDSTHFTHPPSGVPLVEAQVEPKIVSWSGAPLQSRLETSSVATAQFWSDPATPGSWNLAQDPSFLGSDLLEVRKRWNPSSSSMRWSLLHLYQSSLEQRGRNPDSSPGHAGSLYTYDGIWHRNPGIHGLTSTDPRVRFLDGSAASDFFAITATDFGTGTESLKVARRTEAWGLPEWIQIRGSVPAGTTYKLGWRDATGPWIETGIGRMSSCTADQNRDKDCTLGYIDASQLPARADIGILVGDGADRRFQTIPILQGTLVQPSKDQEVRSLFGEAAVHFPAGSLAGKSPEERSISVRALDPSRSGLRLPPGLAIAGPVVEVLPSQTFPKDPLLQPQVKVRLSKDDLTSLSDAAGLGLFKIDPAQGIVVPLEARGTTYLCEQAPCELANAHSVEFTASTSSFSHFALLPKGARDSRTWSFDLEPRTGASSKRVVHISGIEHSQLAWSIDDDDRPDEDDDPTPPSALTLIRDADGTSLLEVPEGKHWVFAWDRSGGYAKSIPVVRQGGAFLASIESLQPIVIGTVNGGARRGLRSNRQGTWNLVLQEGGRVLGFLDGFLQAPETTMDLPHDLLGSRWGGSVQSRVSFQAETGELIETSGPMIRGDATLPSLHLVGSMAPTPTGYAIQGLASATDPEGPVANLRLSLETIEGVVLRTVTFQEGSGMIQQEVPDSHSTSSLRLVATVEDLGGNHVRADTTLLIATGMNAKGRIHWTEAEHLVMPGARVAACELDSRFAIRSDSSEAIEWILPHAQGTFHLVARWRSRKPETFRVELDGIDLGQWSLPTRPSWQPVEPLGPRVTLRGGERLTLRVPTGTHWDGLGMVSDLVSLEGWTPPVVPNPKRAEVWIRDEGPDDPHMVHPRIFVKNIGADVLEGYSLRIRVKTGNDRAPVVQSWWPSPLDTRWDRETGDLWAMTMDRQGLSIEPGNSDFQGVGAAFGLHLPQWETWDRSDDPAWPKGFSMREQVRSPFIPVFDEKGALISEWQCAEEEPWAPMQSLESTPGQELRSTSPLGLEGPATVNVLSEGSWTWQTTVIGLTPLDGQMLEGVLHFGETSHPLSGWWQEIRIPNPERQYLSIRVDAPNHRRLQIQKWEE